MRWRCALFLALSASVVACEGDELPAPSAAEPPASVGGTWLVTLSNFSDGLTTCNVRDILVELSQSGSSFSGTYSGGSEVCYGGGTYGGFTSQGSIVNGEVNGNGISFDLDDLPSDHFTANVGADGKSMSGEGRRSAYIDDELVILGGSWTATKR